MPARRRTRRGLLAALLLSSLVWVPPLASTAQADVQLKVATPADDVPHPAAKTEWWYFSVMDPATKQTLIVTFSKVRPSSVTTFWYDKDGNKTHLFHDTEDFVADRTPSGHSSAGSFRWDAKRKAYHFTVTAHGIDADIWLDNGKPGVTGGPIAYDGQSMYWTNPVATSVASGWVQPTGSLARISVKGWRGYHDHNYGAFDLFNQDYAGWEWAVSHHPDGSAWVMGGVVTGDYTWQGVLVRATARGTTFCRTRIALSDWDQQETFDYPRTVRASCPGRPHLSQTWTVTDPHVVIIPGFTFSESVGKTVPGSIGLVEHFRSWSHWGPR